MKLTPHPILLSLSSRLLQVTVAISPPAAKGASKGRFSAHIRSEGPPQANAGFRNRARGELQRQNKKFYQSEGTADFREKGAFCRESSLLATFLNAAFAGDVSPTRSAPHKYRIYRVYFSSVSRTAPFPFTISAKYWHTRSASPASFRSTPKISLSVSSG